ncbi:LGFP repeat-containing protein [Kineococcus sp. SYSU DK001]|uniref:LGFP repeat-containing protein n=1 Tax=Kineococcus sp. SYSU DK001 TaxID=3383122 RepID=UPI003D7D5446
MRKRLFPAALAGAGLLALSVPAAASAAPPDLRPAVRLPAAVDDLADYEGATTCAPVQPGTERFRDLLLAAYGKQTIGTHRACPADGAVNSEHHEGRALDWMLDAADPADAATAAQFLDWLLADDAENARRLGVMYVIWDGQVWKSYRAEQGWQPYTGPNPHTDHVHLSLSHRGAAGETSWWTGEVEPVEAHWVALGGDDSALGDPVSGRYAYEGATARNYENGTILWTSDTRARAVSGAIGAAYFGDGLVDVLGFPVTDEVGVRGGRANHFEDGSVYWSPATGAHEVHGAIRATWASLGWETSRLGFPTSDEHSAGGQRRSDFEGGYVTWTAAEGATVHLT